MITKIPDVLSQAFTGSITHKHSLTAIMLYFYTVASLLGSVVYAFLGKLREFIHIPLTLLALLIFCLIVGYFINRPELRS